MTYLGLDFGTTNSALARCGADGECRLVRIKAGGVEHDTSRSVLHFDAYDRGPDRRPLCTSGLDGIQTYLAGDGTGRFMQSLKSHLASRSFTSTTVFNSVYSLEDLVALLVGQLALKAAAASRPLPKAVVVGRPVHFVNDDDDAAGDRSAEDRLRKAVLQAGFDEVRFEFEPVAAAWRYEQRLERDERVLIADFGGGTTDLCLVEVGPQARQAGERRVLGTDGVDIAGDVFDQRIIQHALAPRLGLGSTYRLAFGEADVPRWLYSHLSRWHLLSFLKSKKTTTLLETIVASANDKEGVSAFKQIVDQNLGHPLHQAVERAKVALSKAEQVSLAFPDAGIDTTIHRRDFDEWIAPDVARIAAAIDRLMASTNLPASAVDRVFMTGGTSLVPAVRRAFADRFGAPKLTGGEELTSVAAGLALAARAAFG